MNGNDRFSSPRPAFVEPSRPLVTPTLKKENGPIVNLDRPALPALKLPSFGTPVRKEPKEKKEKGSRKRTTKSSEPSGPMVIYGPEHVCSDEEFIVKTRTKTIHDEGVKELFFANGGEEMVDNYDTLAQAFDALRREKMVKLANARNPQLQKPIQNRQEEKKVYVRGLPSDAQRIRERAAQDARRRQDNEEWMNGGKKQRVS